MGWSSLETRDFLTLENVERGDLRSTLGLARACAEGRLREPLAGKTVCLAFFEASTRTAVSFELAARRSGADVISLSEKGSAIAKGESLIDTVVTLDRLGADAIVLRHPAAGAAALAARHTTAAVINAGDGCGQHPTQALLDLYTLGDALGGFDELSGPRAWRSPSSPRAPSCPWTPGPGTCRSYHRSTAPSSGGRGSSTRCASRR